MDEEIAESWEEAADSGVNNKCLNVASVKDTCASRRLFLTKGLALRSSHNAVQR